MDPCEDLFLYGLSSDRFCPARAPEGVPQVQTTNGLPAFDTTRTAEESRELGETHPEGDLMSLPIKITADTKTEQGDLMSFSVNTITDTKTEQGDLMSLSINIIAGTKTEQGDLVSLPINIIADTKTEQGDLMSPNKH
jgi:hypothetical protein